MTGIAVAPPKARRIGASDLLWLALRQHRGLIIGTAVALALFCGYMLWAGVEVINDGGASRCGPACAPFDAIGVYSSWHTLTSALTLAVAGVGFVIGVFWGAPLLAGEYERRTSLLAWSQDVRPLRWLVGKAVPLVILAALLAAGTGQVALWMGDRVRTHGGFSKFDQFNFEAFGPVQLAYAVFGFAAGLLASAVLRRTLPAMGGAAVLFLAARWTVQQIRPNYQTPVRHIRSLENIDDRGFDYSPDALYVNSGYVNPSGEPINVTTCESPPMDGPTFENCLRHNGVFGSYTDYQPVERLFTFRMIETGIFLGLAAVLFALTWLRVRRQESVVA